MHKNGSGESPNIKGIYLNKSVDLGEVKVGGNKKFYIKTAVPDDGSEYLGNYNSSVLSWWGIPV